MEAVRELAKTWTWVRGPSPPEVPRECRVRVDLMFSFTWEGVNRGWMVGDGVKGVVDSGEAGKG